MDKTLQDRMAEAPAEFAAAGLLALSSLQPITREVAGRAFMFWPDGKGGFAAAEVQDVDAHGLLKAEPERIAGDVTLQTQESLVTYALDYRTPASRLFADIDGNRLVAVLDYAQGRHDAHAAKSSDETYTGKGGFSAHVATLQLPFSEEWKTWTGQSGKLLSPVDFARFVLENQPDFVSPDHATLMEMASDLRAARSVKFTGGVNMNSQNESFEYEDRTDVNRKDNLEVPSGFTIRIPVYFGGEKTELQAQLRHELASEGRLTIGYKLLRAENVRQAVFQELVGDVSERSGLPAVYGKAPARSAPDGSAFVRRMAAAY
jgi:uncharacterized protein YfdQ (DUF2303 family)